MYSTHGGQKGALSLGTRTIGSCELPVMLLGIELRFLGKSSKPS